VAMGSLIEYLAYREGRRGGGRVIGVVILEVWNIGYWVHFGEM